MSERDLYGPPPEELDPPVARPAPPAPGPAAPLPEPAPDWPHDGGWAAGPPTRDVDRGDDDAGWQPHPAPPPEHHSRNPVDRLTRRLPHRLRIFVDWVVTIAGAVVIVLLVKAYVVNPYRIPSSSMEPTLHCAAPGSQCEARFSDRVLANRFIYHLRDPRRGEIIVFDTPKAAQQRCGAGGTFVKRLIGLPGEKLEVRLVRGDGYVFINGRRLQEPYVRADRRQVASSFGPVSVPANHYFMLGDNRESSCDSREWGSVPRNNLIGKVFGTYWPPNRLSLH